MTASRPDPHPAMKALLRCLMAATFVVCAAPSPSLWAQPAAAIPSLASPPVAQPPNVGEVKTAARAYHDSGAYARDLALVASEAGAWLVRRAPQVRYPALVLDIDDTSLTNWEVIKADDFGYIINGPCNALPEARAAGRHGACLAKRPRLRRR